MATTEELNRPPSLPPYSEMIFAAIDALKEKEGCSESTISNYIQSTISYLPEDHSNILTENLNILVESNQLILSNNNYSRPESTASVKRGRGRPSKAKDGSLPQPRKEPEPATQSVNPGSEVKRGRGRPKKDPNAPPAVKKVKVAAAAAPASKSGRGRGRPRKVQPELTGVEAN